MLLHRELPVGVTTASGTWSGNTASVAGICYQVIVIPNISSAVYNFSITDPINYLVYCRESVSGTLNELIQLPMKGINTMTMMLVLTSSYM